MELKPSLYISAVLLVILAIAYVGYKARHKKNMSDPDYVEKLKEREAAYMRKKEENAELDSLAGSGSKDDE